MNGYTIKKATLNEKLVAKLLKQKYNTEISICENPYAYWDLFGRVDDKGYLWEVKERRGLWPELVIEEKKISRCLEAADNCNIYTEAYLVVSVAGLHYFYNMEWIAAQRLDVLNCNRTTADGFKNEGVKVDKLMYFFNKDGYEYTLR